MKIILCEDEVSQQEWLKEALGEWQERAGIAVSVNVCSSAEELLFKQEEWTDTDLMILDIELGGMNGMELARKIREKDSRVPLLFATGYEKFVFEGYEVGALSYIMKPVEKEKLFAALDKTAAMRNREAHSVLVGQDEDCERIYADDIYFIESDGHYCRICMKDKEVRVRAKISELEKQLKKEEFFLCHRSYLIHVACIRRITRKEVILDNGAQIPLARGKWEEANRRFLSHYRNGGT